MFVEKWVSMCNYVLHVMFCLRTVSLDVDPQSNPVRGGSCASGSLFSSSGRAGTARSE